MDFQYTFRQAHQDRLEDAGIVRYQPTEGFTVVHTKRTPRRISVQRLRLVLVSLINRITR